MKLIKKVELHIVTCYDLKKNQIKLFRYEWEGILRDKFNF
jgi:hypothetical protein